ncbi:MAG: DUF885 domain-containing protein [Acidobacteria bacterium]|nr:DUF885 domain-containing protein [Acidobacteriota bacterium]
MSGSAAASDSGARTVRDIADDYLLQRAEFDPDAAEAIGRLDVMRIPDLSPEAFGARARLDRLTLAALDALPPTDDERAHALTLALRERLSSDIALDEVGFTRRILAPLATPVHLLRQVFDELPRDIPGAWTRIAAHLEQVPRALEQFLQTLEQEVERGNVVARRQVDVVASQCDAWVRSGYYAGVAAECPVGPDRERAMLAADRAIAATSAFATALRQQIAPFAPAREAVGRDFYRVTSAAFLGTEVDLDELYAWGWTEIVRLQAEADDLAERIIGSRDVAAAVAALDADPARRVPVGEPLRAWLQGRLDATTDAVDGSVFDIPAATRTVEARLSTAASGVMYYTPPDAALTRPGRVWWTVPTGTESISTWREVSTVHHEGVPGHHLQHAVTHGLTELHPWQRLLCQVHGYAEGWAHYAEQLAGEIGLLNDPGERLGMVHAQLWRACRIVIDIGLHLELPVPPAHVGLVGATTWTPAAGVELLVRVAEVDRETAGFEVDRYLGWPGQALAFKVGARLWQQTREDANRALGEEFDLRRFHAEALGLGPMGLGPLREVLARSVAARVRRLASR